MSAPPEMSEASPASPANTTAPIQQSAEAAPVPTLVEKRSYFHNVEGGARGWASVLGAWLIQFSMLGAVMAYGSYQTFYQDRWLTGYSHSSISWIGSLQLFMEFFLGVFGGFLLDSGRWRWTVGGGSVLYVFTFFMLSLCRQGQFAPILLSQGLGMGSGLGLAFLPVTGIVSKHFNKHRAFAMGIITTGTSIGGFVFSLLASKLLTSSLGFAWTVRLSAFLVLASCVLANLLLSDPKTSPAAVEKPELVGVEEKAVVAHQPGQAAPEAIGGTEKMETVTTTTTPTTPLNEKDNEAASSSSSSSSSEDLEALADSAKPPHKPRTIGEMLRDPAYLAIISMGFLVSLGLYFPPFAIESLALDRGISPGLASWLLPLLNLTSVLGRTIPSWLADRYGLFELYVPCTLLAGVIQFGLGGATSSGGIVVLAVLYGFFSGSVPALYFPMISSLDPDVASTGMRLGVACMPVGIACLVGNPIAEALVGPERKWWNGLGYAGASQVVSAMLLAFAWIMEKKRKRALQ